MSILQISLTKLAWPSNSKKNIVPLFFFLFVGHVKHKNIVVTLFKVILKGDTYSLWIAIIGPNFQLGYTLNAPICTRGKWIVCWDLYLLALSLIVYKDRWVKYNTWCKAFVQHGYILRDIMKHYHVHWSIVTSSRSWSQPYSWK